MSRIESIKFRIQELQDEYDYKEIKLQELESEITDLQNELKLLKESK